MESHASAARTGEVSAVRGGARVLAGRVRLDAGLAICAGARRRCSAAIAFVGNGGLQLGSATLVEVGVIVVAGLVVAAALRVRRSTRRCTAAPRSRRWPRSPASRRCRSCGRCTRPTRGSRPTARSPTWPPSPPGSRPCGSRPRRWEAVLYGVLLALAVVSLYGLATKVAPGWLAEDEIYARLREPYGYWNAVGVTAAMGDAALPVARHARRAPALRDGARLSAARAADRDDAAELLARQHPRRARRRRDLARARAAAAEDAGRAAAGRCRRGAGDRLGVRPERAHRRPRRARRARGRRASSSACAARR